MSHFTGVHQLHAKNKHKEIIILLGYLHNYSCCIRQVDKQTLILEAFFFLRFTPNLEGTGLKIEIWAGRAVICLHLVA